MFFTPWKKNDGYHETILSTGEKRSKIFKIRVISLNSIYEYEIIIRDYKTGLLVRCHIIEVKITKGKMSPNIKEIKIMSQREALEILKEKINFCLGVKK